MTRNFLGFRVWKSGNQGDTRPAFAVGFKGVGCDLQGLGLRVSGSRTKVAAKVGFRVLRNQGSGLGFLRFRV